MNEGIRDGAALLTPRLWRRLAPALRRVQAGGTWHGDLPVALLDRCWLRLELVAVDALPARLPPDGSEEAPELVRYRALIRSGLSAWQAELICRGEFGEEDLHRALRRYWRSLESHPCRWTMTAYLQLRQRYRQSFLGEGPRRCPLLVLPRPGGADGHQLTWIPARTQAIGHTCRE
jgi:hypothetical protein